MESYSTCEALSVQSDSIRDTLEATRKRLEKQLAETNEAIDAMTNNPEVARVMELVIRARRY